MIDDEARCLLVDCSRSGGSKGKKVSKNVDGLLLDVSVMARNSGSSCNLDSVRDSLAEA